MKILFFHGWHSTPGGIKPTFLQAHGHTVLNPALPDFDKHHPDVVVGSSRGGAVAMNLKIDMPLVLLCPAWKHWGTATSVKPNTVILHSPTDEVVPFADSQELLRNSGLPESALIAVGHDHRLADEEPLRRMLEVVEDAGRRAALPQSHGAEVIIRPETPVDHAMIRAILIAAFANHPYSHQTEHLIVEALRADDALTVSLVAEVHGNVVGQIAFSPVTIDGKDCGWLALGPVAVSPSHQRQGIGRALVNEGLRVIRGLGAQGCVLVGDPAYYRRFGFEHNPALRMEGIPPEFVMCLPMGDQIPKGNVTHHPAFSIGESSG
jgi:putative acetyltransferase